MLDSDRPLLIAAVYRIGHIDGEAFVKYLSAHIANIFDQEITVSRAHILAISFSLTILSVSAARILATDARGDDGSVIPLMSKDLGADGKEGLVLTVTYPPSASTPMHRHDAHVFVYVLEGSITMQVAGGETKTIDAGGVFYESPTDVHAVSKNASDTETAKFLVFMVKEKGAPPVIPTQQ